jgi:hypothetical protein
VSGESKDFAAFFDGHLRLRGFELSDQPPYARFIYLFFLKKRFVLMYPRTILACFILFQVRYYKTNAMIAERTAKRTHVAILGDTCGVRLVLVMDTPPQREFSCSIHETHSPLSNIYLLWPPFRFHGSALVFVGHYFLFLPPSQIYIAITNCYHSTACTSPGHLRLPHCPFPLTRTIRSDSVKHT